MAVSQVGGTGVNAGTATSGTMTYTFTAHNLGFAIVRGGTVPDTLTCGGASNNIDSAGNAWTGIDTQADGTASSDDSYEDFYAANVASGSTTVTITQSASGHGLRGLLVEYSGCATASPLTDHGTSQNIAVTNTSFTVSTNGTAASTNDLVVGACGFTAATTMTAGTGYTLGQGDSAAPTRIQTEWKAATAGGSQTATGTWTGGVAYAAFIAVFAQATTASSATTAAAATMAVAGSPSAAASLTATASLTPIGGGTAILTAAVSLTTGRPAVQASAALSAAAAMIAATTLPVLGSAALSASASMVNTFMTLLTRSGTNTHWFVNDSGTAIFLSGSQTWQFGQDLALSPATPSAVDFNAVISFLNTHGHNCTIVWHKDLPRYFGWGANGGGSTWNTAGPWPWTRPGPGNASDGLPRFDLSSSDATYFTRIRNRVLQLLHNNIYAIVQIFDGYGIGNNRGQQDAYMFTNNGTGGQNNLQGIDDGYTTGLTGTASMTQTSVNSILSAQDSYVTHLIDALFDLPNVIYEISEEAPQGSDTFWSGHIISTIKNYQASSGYQAQPVLYACLNGPANLGIYTSAADAVAPADNIASTSNQGKVTINDSDHSYFNMWNDTGGPSGIANRNWIWKNVCNAASVLFMDPYLIFWPSSPTNRNTNIGTVTNGVGTTPDPQWDLFRNNLGEVATIGRLFRHLVSATPKGSGSGGASTTWCLSANLATGGEFLVYAPSGGSFTVDLSIAAATRTFNVYWYNPASHAVSYGTGVVGGNSATSFTPPWGSANDAVLFLQDPAVAATLTASVSLVSGGGAAASAALAATAALTVNGFANGTVSTSAVATLTASAAPLVSTNFVATASLTATVAIAASAALSATAALTTATTVRAAATASATATLTTVVGPSASATLSATTSLAAVGGPTSSAALAAFAVGLVTSQTVAASVAATATGTLSGSAAGTSLPSATTSLTATVAVVAGAIASDVVAMVNAVAVVTPGSSMAATASMTAVGAQAANAPASLAATVAMTARAAIAVSPSLAATAVITVTAPTFTISPSPIVTVPPGQSITVTLTGSHTIWTTGSVVDLSPSVGVSIVSFSVTGINTGTQVITCSLQLDPASTGTLTFTVDQNSVASDTVVSGTIAALSATASITTFIQNNNISTGVVATMVVAGGPTARAVLTATSSMPIAVGQGVGVVATGATVALIARDAVAAGATTSATTSSTSTAVVVVVGSAALSASVAMTTGSAVSAAATMAASVSIFALTAGTGVATTSATVALATAVTVSAAATASAVATMVPTPSAAVSASLAASTSLAAAGGPTAAASLSATTLGTFTGTTSSVLTLVATASLTTGVQILVPSVSLFGTASSLPIVGSVASVTLVASTSLSVVGAPTVLVLLSASVSLVATDFIQTRAALTALAFLQGQIPAGVTATATVSMFALAAGVVIGNAQLNASVAFTTAAYKQWWGDALHARAVN